MPNMVGFHSLKRISVNLFAKVEKLIGVDDAVDLIQCMKLANPENLKFQYTYTIDEERRLKHLFYCPAQSFDRYGHYGDVIVFDTTYEINAYDMPCAISVGVVALETQFYLDVHFYAMK